MFDCIGEGALFGAFRTSGHCGLEFRGASRALGFWGVLGCSSGVEFKGVGFLVLFLRV